jgi:GMP synthase-like glutamine amidotransferase
VADNFKVIGTSGNIVTAIANEKNRLYGFQFHPEVRQLEQMMKGRFPLQYRTIRKKKTH